MAIQDWRMENRVWKFLRGPGEVKRHGENFAAFYEGKQVYAGPDAQRCMFAVEQAHSNAQLPDGVDSGEFQQGPNK